MDDSKVFMFPDSGNNSALTTAALLGGNGGFGGMNNPLWMMFMWPMLYPMMSMFGGFGGGWGNGFGGAGSIANQLNNDAGREVILQAILGSTNALSQLAQITNTDVSAVRDAISTVNTKLAEVGGLVGMSGLQVINAVQNGNAALAQLLCQCCCDNRLATTLAGYENRIQTIEQTNLLGSQADRNHAATQLLISLNHGDDRLDICQLTNALTTQASANTQGIKDSIADLKATMVQSFCDIERRELQDKVTALTAGNVQLRSQIDNANQTAAITNYVNSQLVPIQATVSQIAAKQPNTVPVEWPNLTAVNNTPYAGGYGYGFGFGNGFGWNGGWNGSFWG